MTEKNSKEKIIRDNANLIRAEVIQNAIEVEDMVTEALGYLYTPDRNEFSAQILINDVLADLTFDKKIKLIKKFVDLYPENFSHCPNIIRQLNEIRETRNQLAHRAISLPWVFGEDDIDTNNYNSLFKRYVDWKESCDFHKPGKQTFTFTLKELEEYRTLANSLVLTIAMALNNLLKTIDKNNVA